MGVLSVSEIGIKKKFVLSCVNRHLSRRVTRDDGAISVAAAASIVDSRIHVCKKKKKKKGDTGRFTEFWTEVSRTNSILEYPCDTGFRHFSKYRLNNNFIKEIKLQTIFGYYATNRLILNQNASPLREFVRFPLTRRPPRLGLESAAVPARSDNETDSHVHTSAALPIGIVMTHLYGLICNVYFFFLFKASINYCICSFRRYDLHFN